MFYTTVIHGAALDCIALMCQNLARLGHCLSGHVALDAQRVSVCALRIKSAFLATAS
ncbi:MULTISPECIES: hypothetical protein [Shewanella]|uniref:Uncharacterized protein n=1 Tax=Shewanella japonica TaxID=93973 RepID=A0ABM6JPR4_9GAMM|nr:MULTISPECIES: hypothetical protein [Shewanella]ARD23519.1 hypothetical protein SJ2017_3257 [Shewanella japonica]